MSLENSVGNEKNTVEVKETPSSYEVNIKITIPGSVLIEAAEGGKVIIPVNCIGTFSK